MKLNDAIKKRKSVKRFARKKPSWRKIIKCIDAARHAPSAGGQFVTKFILVDDKGKIGKIGEATQQNFVGTAKYLVIAVSDPTQIVRLYGKKGERYTAQQSGAAIQNFLLEIVEQGLATTWVGHFFEDKIKRVLSIPGKMHVEAVFPIGVETSRKTKESHKMELENVIYFNEWGNGEMADTTIVRIDGA